MSILNLSENYVIVTNMLLYIALAIYCIIKYGFKNLATLASLFYGIGGICTYLLYNFPLYAETFSGKATCHMEACLYMFTINALFILCLANSSLKKITHLTHYNDNIIYNLQKWISIILTIILAVEFPTSIYRFYTFGDLGYLRDISRDLSTSNIFLISILQRFFGATNILLLCLIVIRLLVNRKMTNWDKYALFIYALWKINIIFSVVSRAMMIWTIIELLVVFVLFYKQISRAVRKKIIATSLVVLVFFYGLTVTISLARFGNIGNTQHFVFLQYSGQANLNAMALAYNDLKTPFWGYIQFPLFRRLLGFDYDNGHNQDFVYNSYVSDKLGYPNPVYIFHALAGDLYLNFGWLLPLIIAITVYLLLRIRRHNEFFISSSRIILSIVLASVVCKGVFFLDYRNEAGNFLLIYLVLLCYILNKSGKTVMIKTYEK